MVPRERAFGSMRLEFQYCFGVSFCSYDKIPFREQPLGGRAYFSLQLQEQSTRAEKSRWQELRPAGDKVSRELSSLLLSTLSLFTVQDPTPGNSTTSTNAIKSVPPQASLLQHTMPHETLFPSDSRLCHTDNYNEPSQTLPQYRKKIFTLSNKYKMILNPCNRNQDVKRKEIKEIRVKSAGKIRV